MGKKKVKVKKQRDTSKIEERAKSIANIKLPDTNPNKKESEGNIDHYFRFGRIGVVEKFKSRKEESRYKNRK
jgi:hypothetical protein